MNNISNENIKIQKQVIQILTLISQNKDVNNEIINNSSFIDELFILIKSKSSTNQKDIFILLHSIIKCIYIFFYIFR